ncbi:hypothetical protein J4219_00105 [Candidatus Woesearchaeota archaeon]|nr:hypothetical protein [Candidatus Woesearchaeota archaeon]
MTTNEEFNLDELLPILQAQIQSDADRRLQGGQHEHFLAGCAPGPISFRSAMDAFRQRYAANQIQSNLCGEFRLQVDEFQRQVSSYLSDLDTLAAFVLAPEARQSHLPSHIRRRNWGLSLRVYTNLTSMPMTTYREFSNNRDEVFRTLQDIAYRA